MPLKTNDAKQTLPIQVGPWGNGVVLQINDNASLEDYLYLPTPLLAQDMTQRSIFKRSLTGLNSEFSFS